MDKKVLSQDTNSKDSYLLVFQEKIKKRGWCNGKIYVSYNSLKLNDDDQPVAWPDLSRYPYQRVCVFDNHLYVPSVLYEVTIATTSQKSLDTLLSFMTRYPVRLDGDFWMNKTSIKQVTREDIERTKA